MVSVTLVGKPLSEEIKQKMSKGRSGILPSVDTKKKMSEAQKKRWSERKVLYSSTDVNLKFPD